MLLPIPEAAGATTAEPAYVLGLQRLALARGLSQAPAWQRLLHYRRNVFDSGVHSLIDEPAFFLAPDGASNPESELAATLGAFLSGRAAACRFVARYRWLEQELQFDRARLPPLSCPDYERWRAQLSVESVTLIFPAAFLNNPASMFGHTLLRLDSAGEDDRTRLLAQSVSYSASTTDKPGVVYAVKGLLGGYTGRFSMAPYFVKVQEYNDIENRDIWEYRLALSPEEVDRLLRHLWELVPAYFDYFFFDENCSYHLLALLEVARPDLDLTREFRLWTIPADTVRAVVRQEGLVRQIVFRPARAAVVRDRAAEMDDAERALARELGTGESTVEDARLAALTLPRQAQVLELAQAYARFRNRDESSLAGRTEEGLLSARSKLPAATGKEPPIPRARPDQGHGSARVAIGAGRDAGHEYTELRWRPAYHDLLDDEHGFTRGAQVQFFDTAVRRYADGATRLEQMQLLDAVSLTPRDEFVDAVSWSAGMGWKRRRLRDGSEPLVFGMHGGPGLTVERGGSLIYGLVDVAAEIEGKLRRGYAIGAGPAAGWIADITPAWRVMLEARAIRFVAGEERDAWSGTIRQRVVLGRNAALRVDVGCEREFGESQYELNLSVHFYH
jgi:hypothetical protein